MKGILKGKYETGKGPSGDASLDVNTGDVKLRASIKDFNVPKSQGVVLALEKPDAFIVDYNVLKKDFQFQFKNSIRVLKKPLNLTYKRGWGDIGTNLEGTMVFDDANKASANYTLTSRNYNLKYTYTHKGRGSLDMTHKQSRGDMSIDLDGKLVVDDAHTLGSFPNCKLKYAYLYKGLTTLEPSYDVANNSWDFSVSQKLSDDNLLTASYNTSSHKLGLKWLLNSKLQHNRGSLEIAASLNLAEKLKVPEVTAQTTFNFEI